MQIHELKVKKKKSAKVIGRGGRRGTYSGRGSKGQKARSGGNVDPLFEGGRSSLIERLKKTRGFKAINAKKNIIDLDQIEKAFNDGDAINIESLINAKLVSRSESENGAKILGDGKITKKVTVEKGILVSKSAVEAIEKAGGKIEKTEKKIKKEKKRAK